MKGCIHTETFNPHAASELLVLLQLAMFTRDLSQILGKE